MTEDEKILTSLAKDLAILTKEVSTLTKSVELQQTHQAITTKNVRELTKSISDVNGNHLRLVDRFDDLNTLRNDISDLQKNQRWGVLTIGAVIIVSLVKMIIGYNIGG